MTARRYRQVAARLREMIAEGRWAGAERLPPERELAEEMDAPRATLREALIMLEVEGLVEVRRNSGVYVRDSAAPALTAAADVGPFELLRARQVLESAIAAEAARHVTGEDLAQMEAALAQEAREIEAADRAHAGDAEFHRLVAAASQNTALTATVETLWRMRERSRLWAAAHKRIFSEGYRREWRADHHEILAALRERDSEAARAAMWRHLGRVGEVLMALTDPEEVAR